MSKPDITRQLKITEIFHSLQGESRLVGLPTVFVRLTGCPLRCAYCDTTYAFTGGAAWTLEDILTKVAGYNCRYVCVTGGEPLAQKGSRNLLAALCDAGHEVSLETCGALSIKDLDPRVSVVMDLKTPSSGEEGRALLGNLGLLRHQDQLKFVIGDRPDYTWARQVIERQALTGRCEILFSPIFGKLEAYQLAEWILEDRLEVRFQLQLHKILWGDERGR